MKVTVLVLNAEGEPHFQATDHINLEHLFQFAKDREGVAREKELEWMTGFVTVNGLDLVKAVETGENEDVTRAVINMTMATWLVDSLFCGVSAEQYRVNDLHFVVANDGAVMHTRIPSTHQQALDDGDSLSLAGVLTPKVWTDKQGIATLALDMVTYAVLTAYHVQQKRRTVRGQSDIDVDQDDVLGDG